MKPNDFNYGDFFGQDWTTHSMYRVVFSGAVEGVMLLEASDPATAEHDARDFQKRFNLFQVMKQKRATAITCTTTKLERRRE